MHMYVPYMCTCIYNTTDTVFYQSNAVATIFSDACFCTVTCIIQGGYYSRVATIRGRLLFEGGNYSRVATIRGWQLFKGGVYFFGKPADITDDWIRYAHVQVIQ